MNIEAFREYCLAKPMVTETLPFGPETLVFKVAGKMFAATGLDEEMFRVNLKCNPERAQQLREAHPQIIPGWHMNKKHWNTVSMQDDISDERIREWIRDSYDLVVAKLPKKDREKLSHES